jgi:hypothetical protein
MEGQRTESGSAGRAEPAYDAALLETLSCEIGARPAAAPHFGDVAPALRGLTRGEGALLVDFDAAVSDTVAQIVEAERLCCPDLGWRLERPTASTPDGQPLVRLRIEGTQDQLAALAAMFAPEG